VPSWSVPIVFAAHKVIGIVEFELFFEWQGIELASKGKLVIYFFLADVEILHIKEAYIEILCWPSIPHR
jgi:hypothetical protein